MIGSLIERDVKLALRSGGAFLHSLLFFILFIMLSAVALGGEAAQLRPLAPALIWLAIILSLLLSFERLFGADYEDGTLEQLTLSGAPLLTIVIAKLIAHWLLIMVPLLILLPIGGYSLGLTGPALAGLFNAALIGSPALIIYGGFASACMIGYRGAALIIIVLTVPLILPVLIFALEAVDSFAEQSMLSPAFKMLIGINLISAGLGIPAIAGALKANLD